jgi:hypothetical protein
MASSSTEIEPKPLDLGATDGGATMPTTTKPANFDEVC